MNLLLALTALAAGIGLATQAAVNSRLAAGLGNDAVASVFVSFAGGTVLIALYLALRGGWSGPLAALPGQPAWRFAGGLLGATAVVATVYLVPRLGLANMVALVIAGQLIASALIDHHGWLGATVRPISAVRVGGSAVMALGVLLVLYGDQWLARLRGD